MLRANQFGYCISKKGKSLLASRSRPRYSDVLLVTAACFFPVINRERFRG
jgi:hypothetical protein